jgi:hypothetical protein
LGPGALPPRCPCLTRHDGRFEYMFCLAVLHERAVAVHTGSGKVRLPCSPPERPSDPKRRRETCFAHPTGRLHKTATADGRVRVRMHGLCNAVWTRADPAAHLDRRVSSTGSSPHGFFGAVWLHAVPTAGSRNGPREFPRVASECVQALQPRQGPAGKSCHPVRARLGPVAGVAIRPFPPGEPAARSDRKGWSCLRRVTDPCHASSPRVDPAAWFVHQGSAASTGRGPGCAKAPTRVHRPWTILAVGSLRVDWACAGFAVDPAGDPARRPPCAFRSAPVHVTRMRAAVGAARG